MKKLDLKNGDVCTLRNGSIVTNENDFKLEFQNGNDPLSLLFYNENLTRQANKTYLDIMKVTRNGAVLFDREQQESNSKVARPIEYVPKELKRTVGNYYTGIEAKMQADHEARAAEYKAKKDAGDYAFDSEKAYTTEEIKKKINGFAYEKIQFDFLKFKNWFNAALKAQAIEPIELLRSLPESVQLVIVNAMSEEQKTSLINK